MPPIIVWAWKSFFCYLSFTLGWTGINLSLILGDQSNVSDHIIISINIYSFNLSDHIIIIT